MGSSLPQDVYVMFITLAIWTNKTHVAGSLRLWTEYLVIWQVYFPTYCYNAVIYKLISCVRVYAFAYMTLSLPAGFMCRMQCGLSIANLYIPGIAFHGTCNNSHFFIFQFPCRALPFLYVYVFRDQSAYGRGWGMGVGL